MTVGFRNPRYKELIEQSRPVYSDPQTLGVSQIQAILVGCCVIAEAMDGIAESVRGLTEAIEELNDGEEG